TRCGFRVSPRHRGGWTLCAPRLDAFNHFGDRVARRRAGASQPTHFSLNPALIEAVGMVPPCDQSSPEVQLLARLQCRIGPQAEPELGCCCGTPTPDARPSSAVTPPSRERVRSTS